MGHGEGVRVGGRQACQQVEVEEDESRALSGWNLEGLHWQRLQMVWFLFWPPIAPLYLNTPYLLRMP